MELVPFHEKWSGSESKLDLKAIYRRKGPGITLTGPLPVRRHSDWMAKGFTFVCLATLGDLGLVANDIRSRGLDPLKMRECYDQKGFFDVPKYLNHAKLEDDAFLADLQAKVDKFGAEAVTEMMRLNDPGFVMPESIVSGRKEAEMAKVEVGSSHEKGKGAR